jgi:predicted Zn-dependent protease
LTLEAGREVLDRLLDSGLEAAEVYVKRGRSRRFELDSGSEATLAAEEAGWSVRAADRRSSFFFASSGAPAPIQQWPRPIDDAPLALPEPAPIEGWSEPPEVAEPILGEDEGWRLLRRLAADLGHRLPGATLHAVLDDGSSEVRIWNHHGLDAGHRGRFAALRLEARATLSSGSAVCTIDLAERSARSFPVGMLADRVVDLLAVRGRGAVDGGEDADVVLAPEVAARLLAPLAAVWSDRSLEEVAALLELRDGRVASSEVTIYDDGRHPRGALQAPFDGEGVPTGERVLIDGGRLCGTILPWERSGALLGCRARAGWRDLLRVGPSHFYLAPRAEVAPSSLVEDLADGFYLLDAGDGGSYDLAAGCFSLPVWGFRIAAGRPLHPLGEARLMGDPRRLLHAVCGVARDLRFVPLGAMIGSPSLLVRGLALRQGG